MGWLFGRKKKKKNANFGLHDDQSLSFGPNEGNDTVIKPDQFKAAAGIDTGLGEEEHQDLQGLGMGDTPMDMNDSESDAWGQLGSNGPTKSFDSTQRPQMLNPGAELPSNPQPTGTVARRLTQDYKYLQVQQYKRILGELGDLSQELSHMTSLGKSLDKAEYNEEKHFVRLKETMRKSHDKVLQADRILFSHK
jgi:hypothetical protein